MDSLPPPTVSTALVARLAERAAQTESLRQLPSTTIEDYRASGLDRLLLPKRYGGAQAEFPEILNVVRQLAHGCTSSAWTLGFYTLHNWMLALFNEQAQDEVFADGAVLCPAPLAPSGRAVPQDGGFRLTGRWSWATGIMAADWVLVGALCGPDDAPYPALMLLPASDVTVDDVWHTAGMRGTGSNDVVAEEVWVPGHRIVTVADIYRGTAPGAELHNCALYRWPMVPALALTAAMPALGSAELVADLFAQRLGERVIAYSGAAQKNQPAAQVRLGGARARLRAMRALADSAADDIQDRVAGGRRVERPVRAGVRAAAAHIVHESRSVIADLLEAAGASAQFLDHPLQRAKRDVDVISGHVVFDYDGSRELAGALEIGAEVSPFAMV